MKRVILSLVLAAFAAGSLFAQNSGSPSPVAPPSGLPKPEPYKAAEFPPWARDLRRFEIVTIGVLPFAIFYSYLAYDLCRYLGGTSVGFSIPALGNSNPFVVTYVPAFDLAYAPWPVKSATSYVTTTEEKALTIITAVSLSIIVGVADYFIVKAQDRAERRKQASLMSQAPPLEPETEAVPEPESAPEASSP